MGIKIKNPVAWEAMSVNQNDARIKISRKPLYKIRMLKVGGSGALVKINPEFGVLQKPSGAPKAMIPSANP